MHLTLCPSVSGVEESIWIKWSLKGIELKLSFWLMSVNTSISPICSCDIWVLAQKYIVISWHTKKAITFALQSKNRIEEYYQNLLSQQSNNLAWSLNPRMFFTTRPTAPTQKSSFLPFMVISPDVLFIFITHQASTTQSQLKVIRLIWQCEHLLLYDMNTVINCI